MNIRESILSSVTVITGICAVVLTVHVVRQSPGSTSVGYKPTPVSLAVVRRLESTGRRIGPPNAKLTIIEFGDFQCPVCGAYERVLDSMRQRHPGDFAIVFHQFPLAYHPLAMPLARASECAAMQGRFEAFHDSVYADQALLGVVPLMDFGRRAGLPDTARFRKCVTDTTQIRSIERDIAEGRRLGVPGTPTIVAGGMMHTSDLGVRQLEALLAGG